MNHAHALRPPRRARKPPFPTARLPTLALPNEPNPKNGHLPAGLPRPSPPPKREPPPAHCPVAVPCNAAAGVSWYA